MIQLVWFVVGLGLLVLGGEAVVRGALASARRLNVSPLLAGLVIVGFGTSAPELVVALSAVLNGHPEVAVGNAVGSNIANILLVLGLCALVLPLTITPASLRRDGAAMLGATVFFILVARDGLSRLDGVMCLVALVTFMVWSWRQEKNLEPPPEVQRHHAEAQLIAHVPATAPWILLLLASGFACLIFGGHLLVDSAVAIGGYLGVPEVVMGLTLVAVGTSLPELAVSLIAVVRRQADVAVGNILGSNIFNILGILGVSALVMPLDVSGRLAHIDQWVMLGASGLLLAFLITGLRLNRIEAGVILLAYGVYITLMIV